MTDTERLDWLEALPARHGWQGWMIDFECEFAMGTPGIPIRQAIDKAMADEGQVVPAEVYAHADELSEEIASGEARGLSEEKP